MSKHVRPVRLSRRPTVSVIVPCYNYGHYLADAVGSALDQDEIDVDVLIVDDASPDGSGDVAEALAAADPRVRAIRHAVNRGHIETYNEALAIIEGDYVALVSADDLLTPGALTRAASLLDAHPSVGFVYGYPVTFSDAPPVPEPRRVRSWTVWSGREWIVEPVPQGSQLHLLARGGDADLGAAGDRRLPPRHAAHRRLRDVDARGVGR